MIVIKLIGGLGNQMFQYALGRHLALKNNTQLILDISGFKTYKLHRYSLNFFNIEEKLASKIDIWQFQKKGFKNFLGFGKNNHYIKENYFEFRPEILEFKGNLYLDGYWQSEKYFKTIESILRKEFTIKEKLDTEFIQAISSTSSISVHIRRTDYITNPRVFKVHGVCSIDYFNQAVNRIKQIVGQPHFFIFSDDINWAKNNLKIGYPTTFIEHGPEKNYVDLILMSRCKHNIIANSSFSWWGAWLNKNPEKIVITPEQWFKDKSKNTKDLIPEGWLRI